ncbi:MAG: MGMT family protein [Candidatus Sabulitectum sp.]|nr:MGMT family protein [Candidatus Sabulitectum sp.]
MGNVMYFNPFPLVIPCHRVGGKSRGFSRFCIRAEQR